MRFILFGYLFSIVILGVAINLSIRNIYSWTRYAPKAEEDTDWALDVAIRELSSTLWLINDSNGTRSEIGSYKGPYSGFGGTSTVFPAVLSGIGDTPYPGRSNVVTKMEEIIRGINLNTVITTIGFPTAAEVEKSDEWISSGSSGRSFELVVDACVYAVGSEWVCDTRQEEHCHSMTAKYTLVFSFDMGRFNNPENWGVSITRKGSIFFDGTNRRFVRGAVRGAQKVEKTIVSLDSHGYSSILNYWERSED